jgi:hypothetical protein
MSATNGDDFKPTPKPPREFVVAGAEDTPDRMRVLKISSTDHSHEWLLLQNNVSIDWL